MEGHAETYTLPNALLRLCRAEGAGLHDSSRRGLRSFISYMTRFNRHDAQDR